MRYSELHEHLLFNSDYPILLKFVDEKYLNEYYLLKLTYGTIYDYLDSKYVINQTIYDKSLSDLNIFNVEFPNNKVLYFELIEGELHLLYLGPRANTLAIFSEIAGIS